CKGGAVHVASQASFTLGTGGLKPDLDALQSSCESGGGVALDRSGPGNFDLLGTLSTGRAITAPIGCGSATGSPIAAGPVLTPELVFDVLTWVAAIAREVLAQDPVNKALDAADSARASVDAGSYAANELAGLASQAGADPNSPEVDEAVSAK